MTDDEALSRLAEMAGILPAYFDVRGRRHETSPQTARALLTAQGIPCATADEVALSLVALEEEPWREGMPPVIVAREGKETLFALHLAAGMADRRLQFQLHLEAGGIRPVALDLAAVPLSGVREIDGCLIERRLIALPPLPIGYHRLELSGAAGDIFSVVIAAPRHCHLPPAIAAGQRRWGIAAQLYALGTARNMGMGDFTDLASLLAFARRQGADAVGINPLHALFPAAPAHASPYGPNSRLFFNPLYLDVEAISDFAESAPACALMQKPAIVAKMDAAKAADHVDYDAVAAVKLPVLSALYDGFCERHLHDAADPRSVAFRAFVEKGGLALERFALHAVLCESFGTQDWSVWPAPYRDPASDACRAFAAEHEARLGFHHYLQWQCDLQLGAAAAEARMLGMEIGIYGDLAVSSSPDGADVWGAQDIYVAGARVGAPPDPFAEGGQEWGVVPLNPRRLRKTAYAHFIALLRANMRHFGALRIDHAMELTRLFWIPRGAPSSSGAYVAYPLDELLAIVALESVRNKCLVIGEGLGTVPEGFREHLADSQLLSYQVLYFENEHGRFKQPDAYPPLAAACVSTHDLATLKGYWEETDLDDRRRAGVLAAGAEYDAMLATRRADKRALVEALAEAGLVPQGAAPEGELAGELTAALAAAIHQFLARSAARLFMVQIDDVAGEAKQTNMPGTTVHYPNWSRRVPLDGLGQKAYARAILDAVAAERPRP